MKIKCQSCNREEDEIRKLENSRMILIRNENKKKEEEERKKEESEMKNMVDFMISDSTNIWGIYPIREQKQLTKIKVKDYVYSKYDGEIKTVGELGNEKYIISKTKIRLRYYNKVVQIAKILYEDFNENEYLSFFMPRDKEGNIIENENIMIMIFDRVCFLIAPTGEADEEEKEE